MDKKAERTGRVILEERRNHRRWTTLVVLLAILVSTGTFFVLRHNATAATYKKRVLDCQQISGTVAHIHNDDCYDKNGLVCTLEEIAPHLHTSECYERELVCGLEESAGHVHTEECWAEETDLVCGLDEHVHGPECYELTLICGEDEALPEYDEAGELVNPGHVHTEACYANELICEEEEHVHSESCYETTRYTVCGLEEGEGAHQHDESCYVSNLICGQEELPVHIHDANCFITVDLTPEEVEAMRAAEEAAAEEEQEPSEEPAEGEDISDETAKDAEPVEGEPVDAEPAEGENAVDAEAYPAQHFEGEAAGLLVTVNAPAGAFPKDTEMVVSPIEDENVLNAATAEVQGEVVLIQGVDISFYDADGNEIEPLLPIQVEMVPSVETAPIIPDMTEVSNEQTLVHVDNELSATVVEQEDNLTPEVRFESDSFSAYIVVYTKIEKTVLASDGQNYRITVICDPASGIPEDATLEAEEIPLDSEIYDSYRSMTEEALEKNKSLAFARFFDISILVNGVEIQPTGPVQVKIELANLPEETVNADTQVIHFGENTEILTPVANDGDIRFQAESFSVYGVVYTVDFEYEVDGKTYQFSIPGGNIITLSDLVEVLGILGNTNFDTVDAFMAAVENVEFSDPALVKVVCPEEDTTVGEIVRGLGVERQLSATIGDEEALALEEEIVHKNEWTLISIKPFDTDESLTITMKNGDVLMVKVTDASSVASNDGIKSLLTDVSITGAKQEGGAYVFYPDQPYGIHLTFKEVNKESGQFPMGGSFTYQLPAGLMPSGSSVSNYLEITLSGGDHAGETVKLNYTINDSGLITFTWDQTTNPGAYSQLADALYSQFKLDLECTYNGDSGTLDFGNEITKEVTVKNNGTVSVNKVGKYNPVTNCVDYTVSVYSDGITKNVVITDTVSGSALTYNRDAASSSSIYGKEVPSPTSSSNGFSLTIPQMADQETVTVKYSAAVNLEGLTKNPDGTWGTVTETGNKVIVNSKDNPPVEKENSGKDFENKISMSNIGKSGSSVEADETGHATVNWTIHANDNTNVSMAGHTISDSISGNSVPMSYNSTGIHVVAYKPDGTLAYEKDIAWGSDGLTKTADGQSWSWSVPNQAPDTQKLAYVITYTTDVDVTGRLINTEVKNHSENDYGHSSDSSATVTPDGGALNARKKVVKTDVTSKTVTWEINFDVPATGLDSAQIIDTMPTFWENGQVKYFDSYLGNATISITPELAAGESYEATMSDDGRTLTIDFYKTEDEQKVTGLSATGSARKIRVQFQTEFNEEWLTAAEGHQNEDNYTNHTNTGRVILNGQTIGVRATTKVENNEPGMSKVHGTQTTYNVNGNSLPAFPYVVTLEGVTDEFFDDSGMLYVEDTFNGKYLAYYPQTQNNTTGDNDLVGFLYGAASYQDLSKGGDPIHNVKGKSTNRVVSSPSDGKILISISRDDIPLDDSGNFYPYYYIFYYLTVKDPIALEKLNTAIQQSDSGVYSLLNTVTNQKFGSTTDTAEIEIPVLDKAVTSPNGQAYYNNGNWMVDFKLDVNPDALDLGDEEELTLTDDYTNLAVDYTTIKIQKVVNGNLVDTTDADGVSWNRKGNRVTYTLQNGVHYVITYKARITGEPGNDGKVHYDNTAEYFGVKKWTKGDQNISSGGSGSSPTYGITVFKHKKGAGSSPLSGAKFKLYKYTATQEQENGWENQPSNAINTNNGTITPVDSGWQEVKEMTTGSDGVAKTTQSDSIQRWTWYMLVETEAPVYEGSEHYQLKNFGYVFWITDKGAADYSHYVYLNDDVVAIDNEPPVPETVDIGVTKTWTNDNGDISKRKDITVRLFADGVPYADWTDKSGNHLPARDDTVKVLPIKSDGTTDGYTWTGLKGGPVYSVVEDGVAGYTTTYSPKSSQVSGTINIKNKYIPGKTYIHVEKNWSSDIAQENRAEDITVQLKRKVSANATIQFVRYDGFYFYSTTVPAGSTINITYKEKNSQNTRGYTVYSGLGITGAVLQNESTHWGTGDGSVIISNLLATSHGITVQFPNDGFSWENLDGEPTVTVIGSSGGFTYSEDVNFNNENHYYTISAANGWKIDIDRLVKEDDDGKYIYYIEEVGVDDNTETPEEAGYIVTYENNNGIVGGTGNVAQDTIKVTNSPEPGALKVKKTVSGPDAKGTYSIAVKGPDGHYYGRSGEDKGTDPFYVSFKKDDTVTWRNLPAGTYTIEEQDANVEGYTWRVTGIGPVEVPSGETAEVEVTNAYEEPQTGALKLTKAVTVNGNTPTDSNKALTKGTYEFTIHSVADGDNKANDKTVTITFTDGVAVSATGGSFDETTKSVTVSDLVAGDYTITETAVSSMSTTVSGGKDNKVNEKANTITVTVNAGETATQSASQATFTNDIETVEKTATKTWSDDNPNDLTIYFKLFYEVTNGTDSDGHPVIEDFEVSGAEKKLTAGTTSVTWTDLPKYDANGNEYDYVVREYVMKDGNLVAAAPDGYVKVELGLSVTNTKSEGYNPKTTYTGLKTWVDSNDKTRPDNLHVTLNADGKATDYVAQWTKGEGEHSNEWTYTFSDLPVFADDGHAIVYTAVETPVSGYTASDPTVTPTNYVVLDTQDDIQRLTTNSSLDITLAEETDLGFIAIKKNANKHLIWTQRAATATEKAKLIEDINKVEGFVGEMSNSTVEWVSGLPIERVFEKGTVTVTKTSSKVMHVQFVRENQWAQICYGSYKYNYTPGTTDFTNTIKTTDYVVTKTWGEGQQPPEGAEIEIKLKATVPAAVAESEPTATPEPVSVGLDTIGVSPETVKLNGGKKDGDTYTGNDTEDKPWEYRWVNLPKYDKDGKAITYSAEETVYKIGDTVVDLTQYAASVSGEGTAENPLVITNQIPKTSIKVFKTWAGSQVLPEGTSVTLTLSATVPGTATDEDQNPAPIPVGLPNVTTQIVLNGGKTGGNDTSDKPWEYEWADLPEYDQSGKKITYVVTETKYTIGTTEYTTGAAADTTPKEGYQFSFTNTVPTEINILKTDKHNQALTGAKFILKQYENSNYQRVIKTFDEQDVGAEGENKGKLKFGNLTAGYYELVETKSPTGYVISGEAPRFTVVFDETAQALKVNYENRDGALVNYNPSDNTFTVINEAGTALPQTGGIGTTLFTALGGLMTATAGAILTMKSYRRRKS